MALVIHFIPCPHFSSTRPVVQTCGSFDVAFLLAEKPEHIGSWLEFNGSRISALHREGEGCDFRVFGDWGELGFRVEHVGSPKP